MKEIYGGAPDNGILDALTKWIFDLFQNALFNRYFAKFLSEIDPHLPQAIRETQAKELAEAAVEASSASSWAWAGGLTQFIAFLVVAIFIVLTVLFVVLFERRIIGFFQLRLGPNRVGPQGLFQTVADALKLLQKEDIMPLAVEPVVYNVAPFVVFVPSLVAFVVIPLGAGYIGGQHRVFIVQDLNIGIMYLLAVSSVALIGFLMAGWGSNNKYALISAMRNAAQIISYEVPMVIAILGELVEHGPDSTRMAAFVARSRQA